MTITIYGIKNCDTMKKAFKWLEAQGLDYVFHDYKKLGVDEETLTSWCDAAGWDVVLNKRGTTFRKLPDEDKLNLDDAKAIGLMVANPSMIKRPVLEDGGNVLVGFNPDAYQQALG